MSKRPIKNFVVIGIFLTATVLVPQAGADTPDLTPFVGTWQKHEARLVIDGGGTGVDTYQDLQQCPNCPYADAPSGSVTFTLTDVADGVAAGTVTASSDAQNHPVGEPVTATLADGSPGQLLVITLGGVAQLPFCDATAEATGQCGA